MDKHKVVKLSPELKKFIRVISLAKYLACALMITLMISMMVCAFFVPEGDMGALIKLAFPVSLFIDGFILIMSCFIDMAVTLIKWFATHKISFLVVEDRDVEII